MGKDMTEAVMRIVAELVKTIWPEMTVIVSGTTGVAVMRQEVDLKAVNKHAEDICRVVSEYINAIPDEANPTLVVDLEFDLNDLGNSRLAIRLKQMAMK